MVSFRKYILVFSGILLIRGITAQDTSWISPSPSTNTSPLIINVVPSVDGVNLTEGDYIGVFSRQGRCFGLSRWKDTINFSITVYGFDGSTDGFRNGDTMNLKVWIKNENCMLDRVSQVSTEKPLVFANAVANRVSVLNFERLAVNYPRERFCLNEKEISPVLTYPVNDLKFAAVQSVDLNENTGRINPGNSLPGNYSVSIITRHCLADSQLNVTLLDYPAIQKMTDTLICDDMPLKISLTGDFSSVNWSNGQTSREIELSEPSRISYRVMNAEGCSNSDTFNVRKTQVKGIEFSVDQADCYRSGKLRIHRSEIDNGIEPYAFRLKSRLADKDSFEIGSVPEGFYTLEVVNSNGCVLRYSEPVIVEKDCLNDHPVFSPNDDGLDDRYFIDLEGIVKVFDRNGILRRRLECPCYFNGADESGTPLPMGTYLLVPESGKSVTLTIIR